MIEPTFWEYWRILDMARTCGLHMDRQRDPRMHGDRNGWGWYHFLAAAVWLAPGLVERTRK